MICSCSSAYRRFRERVEAGVFLELWRRGLLAYDDKVGIEWEWLALDGALGKAPLGGERTGPNPTDRARKGRSDRSLPRARGIPLGIESASANVNDFKLTRATLASIVIERPAPTRKRPRGLCLDRGYDYDEVRALAAEFGFTCHIRSRGEEAQALKREAAFVHVAGSSSAPTPGCIASVESSCAGRSAPTPTWQCSTSPAP
jgi:putative transposase